MFSLMATGQCLNQMGHYESFQNGSQSLLFVNFSLLFSESWVRQLFRWVSYGQGRGVSTYTLWGQTGREWRWKRSALSVLSYLPYSLLYW